MACPDQDACPVDHKAREAWLQQARAAEASKSQSSPAACPVDHSSQTPSKSWNQTLSSYLPWTSSTPAPPPSATAPADGGLDTERVVSTIPRATSNPDACPVEHGASANAEIESGAHESGNWVYPSEKMFFDAMRRKGYDARTADMKTVVPIHNAVNERAWKEICQWEKPYLAQSQYDPPRYLPPLRDTRTNMEADVEVQNSSPSPTRWTG